MSFLTQLSDVGRVVTALILRETRTRFGRHKLGFLWAFIEPALYVVIFLTIRTFIRNDTPFGESIILFILTALLMLRVFIAISGGMMAAITANQALLAYPPVKPNDVIVARFLLEALTMLTIVFTFYIALWAATDLAVIVDIPRFSAGVAATVYLGLGVGVFNAVVSVLLPLWARVFNLIRLPLFILSGLFYLPKALPPVVQDILWWNPVLHCVEWARSGTYLTYDPLLDRAYVLAVASTMFVTGLLLERVYRFKLLSA